MAVKSIPVDKTQRAGKAVRLEAELMRGVNTIVYLVPVVYI